MTPRYEQVPSLDEQEHNRNDLRATASTASRLLLLFLIISVSLNGLLIFERPQSNQDVVTDRSTFGRYCYNFSFTKLIESSALTSIDQETFCHRRPAKQYTRFCLERTELRCRHDCFKL